MRWGPTQLKREPAVPPMRTYIDFSAADASTIFSVSNAWNFSTLNGRAAAFCEQQASYESRRISEMWIAASPICIDYTTETSTVESPAISNA